MITINFIAAGGHPTGAAGTKSLQTSTGKSLMEAAVAGGITGIAADCGGLLTCATCHVMVLGPLAAQIAPPDAEELTMLAFTATPSKPNSRLSCQIRLTDALDGLTVELPPEQY